MIYLLIEVKDSVKAYWIYFSPAYIKVELKFSVRSDGGSRALLAVNISRKRIKI